MGDVTADLSLFMGAVIDARAFAKHAAALERARSTASIQSWPVAPPTTPKGSSCAPP